MLILIIIMNYIVIVTVDIMLPLLDPVFLIQETEMKNL